MRGRILCLFLVSFASGIFLLISTSLWFVVWTGVLLSISATVVAVCGQRTCGAVILVATVFLLLGGLRAHLEELHHEKSHSLPFSSELSLEGTVVTEPDIRDSSVRVKIRTEIQDTEQTVLVSIDPTVLLQVGDRVRVEGVLEQPKPFETGEGRVFQYDAYLAADHIYSVMYRGKIQIIGMDTGLGYQTQRLLFKGKEYFIEGLRSALPEPHSSLAAGLLVGSKQGLGEELLNDFTTVGLVHVVVLSGYNVLIIAKGVLRVLAFLPRTVASIFAGVAISILVLIAGAGAASVRAGIMTGISLIAHSSGRVYVAITALLVAGTVMLIHSPYVLLYDPGFQLSFVATLGMIFGVPITEQWFTFLPSFLREVVATSVAAQIMVLPLLVFQTGTLSLVSLPINILVLPFIPVAMAASVGAALGGMVIPTASILIGIPSYILLSGVILAAELSADLPYASISLPIFSSLFLVAGYVLIGIYIFKTTRRTSAESF